MNVSYKTNPGVFITLRQISVCLGIVALTGCISSNTIKQSVDNSPAVGVPYSLPKTVINVELSLAQDTSQSNYISLATSAEHVPDEKQVYLLNPESESWLVSNNHHFVLKNGMIDSVSTVDTGEGGAVLANTTTSLINLAKSIAFKAQSANEEPFLQFQSYPTEAEISESAKLLAGNAAKISFDPRAIPNGRIAVPGTHGLMYLTLNEAAGAGPVAAAGMPPTPWPDLPRLNTANIETECVQAARVGASRKLDSFSSMLDGLNYQSLPKRPTRIPNYQPPSILTLGAKAPILGLYTRALQGFDFSVKLYADLWRLREVRAEHMFEKLKARRSDLISALDERVESQLERSTSGVCHVDSSLKDKLDSQIDALNTLALYQSDGEASKAQSERLKSLLKKRDALEAKSNRCRSDKSRVLKSVSGIQQQCLRIAELVSDIEQVNNWRPQEDFLIARSDENIKVAGELAIQVPLRRASIGQTTNTVMFEKGILTEYRQVKPSEGRVVTDSIVSSTSSLYDGVVAIAQIPAQALGFQLDEVNARSALTDAQIIQQNKQDRLDGTRLEIQNVLLQAQLEAIKSDPDSFLNLIDNSGLTAPENEEAAIENPAGEDTPSVDDMSENANNDS